MGVEKIKNSSPEEMRAQFRDEIDLVLRGELSKAVIAAEHAPDTEELKKICFEVVLRSGAIVNGKSESVIQKAEDGDFDIKKGESGNIEVRKIPTMVVPHVPTDPASIQQKAADGKLEFEYTPTKTMALASYGDGKWTDMEFVPAGEINLAPTADRYGQALFGGSRMLRLEDGRAALFRPDEHAKRFVSNLRDLMVPEIDEAKIVEVYEKVGRANMDYLPPHGKGSIYIAPGARATGAQLGVKPNKKFTFTTEAVPAGKIFSEPAKLQMRSDFHRSAGKIKASGNYSITFRSKAEAHAAGFHDILTGDKSGEFIGELSSSNVFFVTKDGVLVTPELNDSILPGITRKSVLEIVRAMKDELGIKGVEERDISFDEIGDMAEAFSTGTGVTINSIKSIEDHNFELGEDKKGAITAKIAKVFEDILAGKYMDHPVFGPWLKVLE